MERRKVLVVEADHIIKKIDEIQARVCYLQLGTHVLAARYTCTRG